MDINIIANNMYLKPTILEYLKQEYPRIVHKGEIGRLAILKWNYENENAGRRCRELENDKLIKKIPDEKNQTQYQYIPQKECVKPLNWGKPVQKQLI